MRENELVQEGEIVLMCASLLIRGEVSLRGTKMESGQMCSPRFSVFNSFQTFISSSLSKKNLSRSTNSVGALGSNHP